MYVPDKNSAEWEKLKAWLTEELNTYYKRLSALDSTEEQTQQLRGTIAFINKLMGLESRPTPSAVTRN